MKFIGMKNLANLVSSPSQKIVFAVTSLIGNLTLHGNRQDELTNNVKDFIFSISM